VEEVERLICTYNRTCTCTHGGMRSQNVRCATGVRGQAIWLLLRA